MVKGFIRDASLVLLGAVIGNAIVSGAHEERKDNKVISLQVGTGQCRYSPSPDGMWWNRDQEHSNRYKTNGCLQLGVHAAVNPQLGFQVDWVNLGWARTNSQAVACANDDCPPKADPKRAECNKELTGDCLYNFRGAGSIKGLKFGVTYAPVIWGNWRPELEAGVLAYKARWSIRVTPLDCTADDRTCSWSREIEQSTRCGSICLSPEVGAMLWWKNIGFGGQYYFRTTQHTPLTAGFGGPAHIWMVKGRITL